MSDTPNPHRANPGQLPQRTAPQRPPIEWPTRTPQQPTQHERTTNIVRQHVERVYEKEGEPNQIKQTQINPEPQQAPQAQHHTMREEPYNWDHYHNAWQQYYHQYFYRYYAGWWHQQKQQQAALTEQKIIGTDQPQEPQTELSQRQKTAKELRDKVRTKVEERSNKVTSSSHFKPLVAAATVGLLFLSINYNQVLVGAVKQYIAPGGVVTTPVIVEPSSQVAIGQEPKIIIPKIGVEAPVVFDEPKVDEASYQAALERGVVRLGNTANPGTKGNVVIGGHSSNNVFNAGKFKYVFVNLKKLDVGDVFYVNYQGVRYTYKITVAKKIITPKETSVLAQTETPTITLFTCDPPGTNVNRLIVQAEQIDPSPDGAATSTNQQTAVNTNNPLPSVAPSLWDRIFSR